MFKTALLAFLLCSVLHDVLSVTDSFENREHVRKIDEGRDKDEISHPKDEIRYDYEKYGKKKYKENKFDKYNKENAYKKTKAHEKKRFINSNEFQDSQKNEKLTKYEKHQNHYESPYKSKEVSYHDKVHQNEKERYHTEQEIREDSTIISLHHDIDVNFINHHEPLLTDAEFIDPEGRIGDNKKKDYIKSANDVIERKVKTNFYKSLKEIDLTSIPPSNNSALVARNIIHNVDWTAIATISANSKMRGSPFVNVISVSDGPLKKGSGVPYFYMTPKDFSSIDLEEDNRCTVTATLAQTDFCKERKLDPESPLCARLILNGKIKKVKPNTDEENFAKQALFSRHPEMQNWPASHKWFFSKLKIKQIILINHFCGASYVSIQDYFNASNE